ALGKAAIGTGDDGPFDHVRLRSEHVADVRRARRIAKYCAFHVVGPEVVPNREAEEVNYFVDIGADQMRAKNAAGVLLDDGLIATEVLGNSARCVPVRRAFGFY